MKKTLLLLLFAVLGMSQVVAQEYEYVPFVREGVKWVYYIKDFNYSVDYYSNPARGDNMIYRTLELKGDTVINGKTYKVMHKYSGDAINEANDTIPVFLREEDKMVYGIIPDRRWIDDCPVQNFLCALNQVAFNTGEEFLLYDFQNPEAYWDSLLNRTGYSSDYTYNHLYSDTIAIGNKLAKRYVGQIWYEYQTIEGIGLYGRNSTPLYLFDPEAMGIYAECMGLEKVVENGEVIFPQNFVEDRYLPLIREGIKWVNEKVVVNNGDTTCTYYTYEFKGNHPNVGEYGFQRKALYRYDSHHQLDVEHDSIVASMRENENVVSYDCNEPLTDVIRQGRDMIDFQRLSASEDNFGDDNLLYYLCSNRQDVLSCRRLYIDYQREPFLNDENFVSAEPIMIDGYRCSRLAYINEQGDTVAYIVEGLGFDSRDMGDLLTPFTRQPDPNADYQEWCGLSHVVKDGQIIYKGMRYREGAFDAINEVVADKTCRPYDPHYYDLMGRAVGTEVPSVPGIYIHRGQKIVVR